MAQGKRRGGRRRRGTRTWGEHLEQRVLISGSISGQLWHDQNSSGAKDTGEPALSGWTVYLDQNRNRQLDSGEASTVSDVAGNYQFSALAAGTYYVGIVTPTGWQILTPGASGMALPATGAGTGAAGTQVVHPLTYTGSHAPIYIDGEPTGVSVTPSDFESSPLIHLNTFSLDARYQGVNGSGFSVAILDTGIDLDHRFFGPDADGNGIADRIVYQYDFADNDADASDHMGHGSNVASIAAGSDATHGGMAPGANIIVLKVFKDGGTGDFADIERALQWVVANAAAYNIAAINMSFGDGLNWSTAQQPSEYGICDELAALAEQDVIVVSSAGNSYYEFQTQGVAYPAADLNSLSVGAVYDGDNDRFYYSNGAIDHETGADRIASFSQRSVALGTIFAPGAVITGANATGGTVGYTGTSQASPHIAGIAVLAQQLAVRQLGRRLTPAEFRTLLATTGAAIIDGDDEDDNVTNTGATFRRVDVQALADAIYAMSNRLPYGYTVSLNNDLVITSADFGVGYRDITPGRPDLQAYYDTGASDSDNITNRDNSTSNRVLRFRVPGTLAGTTVRLYANGVLIGQAAGQPGTTTLETNGTVDVPDGLVQITARLSAPGFPESADSLPLQLSIDTVAPPGPAAPDLADENDSGLSHTDNITNMDRPWFLIDRTSDYYNIRVDGVPAFGLTVLTSSMSRVLLGEDGVHSIRIESMDAAGNTTIGPELLVTVDTQGPNYTGVSPADPTFGIDGVAMFEDVGPSAFTSSVLQPDGKIVAVGREEWADAPYCSWMSIARLNPDGSLDSTFGGTGRVTLQYSFASWFNAVALQSDGKILAAGAVADGSVSHGLTRVLPCFAVVRFNADGTLDSSFGDNGLATLKMGKADDSEVYDIRVQPDGRILLSGYAWTYLSDEGFGRTGMAVARLLPDGSVDPTFGTNGQCLIDYEGATGNVAAAMELLADGRIVVAGQCDGAIGPTSAIAMLTPDGTLDPTFGTGGKVEACFGGRGYEVICDIALQGSSLIIAGSSIGTGVVSRYSSTGVLDTSFGDGGIAAFSARADFGFIWNGVAITPGGDIWLSGWAVGMTAAYLTADGHLVGSFGPSGAWDSGKGYGYGITLQPDGKAIVVGVSEHMVLCQGMMRFVPPEAPSGLALDPASDTGMSSSDRITSDSTPTLVVSGFSGYYRFYRNGVLISDSWLPSGTFTAPVQADGTSGYQFEVTDAAGNGSGLSEMLWITVVPILVAVDMPAVTWRDLGKKRYDFVVHYTGSAVLDAGSIDGDEIQVTGPTGLLSVTLVEISIAPNGKSIDATYRLTPPGGSWSVEDAGSYVIAALPGTVTNANGQGNAAADLGPIPVSLPAPTATALQVRGTPNADAISITMTGTGYTANVNGIAFNYAGNSIRSITVSGLGGNDQITLNGEISICEVSAGAGNDTITGSSGDDLIRGDEDNDLITGNLGEDTLYGNFGNDSITGADGQDSLMGGLGADTLDGGLLDDSIYGGDQMDWIYGREGADYIEGRGKADTIWGGSGNDTIYGGAGSDSILGEDGDDRIYVGLHLAFADTVNGGAGTDTSDGDANDILSEVENVLA